MFCVVVDSAISFTSSNFTISKATHNFCKNIYFLTTLSISQLKQIGRHTRHSIVCSIGVKTMKKRLGRLCMKLLLEVSLNQIIQCVRSLRSILRLTETIWQVSRCSILRTTKSTGALRIFRSWSKSKKLINPNHQTLDDSKLKLI